MHVRKTPSPAPRPFTLARALRGLPTALVIALLTALLAAALTLPALAAPLAGARGVHRDWTRFGGDLARTSATTAPTGITAQNVASLKRQQVQLPGTVDASLIYLRKVEIGGARHDAYFLTTTYGLTLAVDANTGDILWRFTPPGYDSWAGSYRITNSTPVADPDHRYIYAASPDGRIEKLAIRDGHSVWATAITELPQREKIASPLNLFRGRVIAVTGGYIGDRSPYQGHVAILDAANGKLLSVWNSLCSDRSGLMAPASCPASRSAIWGRAGAVLNPQGDIFIATGNGPWNGTTNWGDAVLELDPMATRILANYTPTNNQQLNRDDLDEGSTSPVLLGDGYIAQGGKDGKIRVLKLSAIAGVAPHRQEAEQTVSTPSGADLFTAPALLKASGKTWLFVADNGGTQAWTFADGRLTSAWKNSNGGTSPFVAGGLVYVYDPQGGLRVYDPASGRQVADLSCGHGHWNSPIVVDGRIALPEGNANSHLTSGVLDIWRR